MRIGIYGGTFSPPHMGHVRAAKAFIKAMELSKLFVIPTAIPPHKEPDKRISPEMRFQMCRLAFDIEGCEVSDIEIKRGGKSYTVLTLEEMERMYPKAELMLLCGTDMFLTLDSWFRSDDIFKMCTVVYVRREFDDDCEKKILEKTRLYEEQFGAKIRRILPETTVMSSSDVRHLNKNDDDISEMVPEAVEKFIKLHRLYE